MMRVRAAFLALVGLSACDAPTTLAPPETIDVYELTPLTDNEIRAVIPGATTQVEHFITSYSCGGTWSESGMIVPRYGAYTIVDRQLCSTPERGGTYCMRVYRHRGWYFANSVSSPHAGWRAYRLNITRRDPC